MLSRIWWTNLHNRFQEQGKEFAKTRSMLQEALEKVPPPCKAMPTAFNQEQKAKKEEEERANKENIGEG